MPKFWFHQVLVVWAMLLPCAHAEQVAQADAGDDAAADRPNIVLLVSQSLGYSDLGCYGSEISTPNLDGLAAGGVRFVNAHHNSSRTPSAAALWTGQYSHRVHVTEGVKKGFLKATGRLKGKSKHLDIVASLKQHGYENFCAGNFSGWSPQQLGFDEICYELEGVKWKRTLILKGKHAVDAAEEAQADAGAFTYMVEEAAKAFANRITASQGKPFFATFVSRASMYGSFALQADIDKYKSLYSAGPRAIAEARHAKLVELGLVSGDWPWDCTVPASTSREQKLSHVVTEKELMAQPGWQPSRGTNGIRPPVDAAELMAVYAAHTEMFDRSVGHILQALDQKGLRKRTLIILCCLQGADSHSGGKGRTWTQVVATPFKGMRRSAYSGAINSPFILSWPGKTHADAAGTVNKTLVHLPDILPTILDAAGIPYPQSTADGEPMPSPDGRSLLKTLQGAFLPAEKPLFFELIGHRAVLTDDWKWIGPRSKKGQNPGPGALYNMKDDRLEMHNVANQHGDVESDLAAQWDTWAEEVNGRSDLYKRHLPELLKK